MTYSRKKQLLIVGIVNKREVERGGQRAVYVYVDPCTVGANSR